MVLGYISCGSLEMSRAGRLLTFSLLGVALLTIMAAKVIGEGWLHPQPTLPSVSGPTLLFFNGSRGCECELLVYENADRQFTAWREKLNGDLPVVQVSIHPPGELKKQYKVVRAPTLLLLDRDGQVVWRQDNVISDQKPLDLETFEEQIALITARQGAPAELDSAGFEEMP